MKAIISAAILLLLTAACGQMPGTATSRPSLNPTAQASQRPSPPLLFAVLEAKGTANAWTYNTVAIAGLDGYARAKTTFTPMPSPFLGCMGVVLPPSAHVAAGKTFFADGKGVVRSLALDGTVVVVARFPLTSTQQMLSFAISPDGARLLGTVFTMPNNAYPCSGAPSPGAFTFDAYSAAAGGPSTLLYQETWTKPQNVLALTGWDAVGPLGTYPTVWATQGGGPGSTLGVAVRVDASTGRPGAVISDPTKCLIWDSLQSGAFVCTQDGVIKNGGTPQQTVDVPVSVRSAAGAELWKFTLSGLNGPSVARLNPDGVHVAMCCSDDDKEWLVGRDGSRTKLATSFYGAAWLDSATMIGEHHPDPLTQPPLPLAYVALNAPNTVVTLGFAGLFVGTVRF